MIGMHAIALAEEAKEVMAPLHRFREDFDVNVRSRNESAAHLTENYKSTLASSYLYIKYERSRAKNLTPALRY